MPFLLSFEAPDCTSSHVVLKNSLAYESLTRWNFWCQNLSILIIPSEARSLLWHSKYDIIYSWVFTGCQWGYCDSIVIFEMEREESNYPPIIDCGLVGTWKEREFDAETPTYISSSPSFKLRIRKIPVYIPSKRLNVHLLGKQKKGGGHLLALQLLALFCFVFLRLWTFCHFSGLCYTII